MSTVGAPRARSSCKWRSRRASLCCFGRVTPSGEPPCVQRQLRHWQARAGDRCFQWHRSGHRGGLGAPGIDRVLTARGRAAALARVPRFGLCMSAAEPLRGSHRSGQRWSICNRAAIARFRAGFGCTQPIAKRCLANDSLSTSLRPRKRAGRPPRHGKICNNFSFMTMHIVGQRLHAHHVEHSHQRSVRDWGLR
jgi:hypothetical protein